MKTPFLGGSYESLSHPIAYQTCVNLYPAVDADGKVAGFLGTPGYALKQALGSVGQCRGVLLPQTDKGQFYTVIGNTVYNVSIGNGLLYDTWIVTTVGTLPTYTGTVSMSYNLTQFAVQDNTGLYTAPLGATPNSLTGPVANSATVPAGGRNNLAYLDGFGIYILGGTNQFGISALNDWTTINPLNVASAEALPDNIYAIMATQRELWIMGQATTEIWSVTGAASFPMERIPGGVLNFGIYGPDTAAFDGDGSVFWVTQDPTGKLGVVHSVEYQVEHISTPYIERVLAEYQAQYGPYNQLFGYMQTYAGRNFYVLSAMGGIGDFTYAFDKLTGKWHRRAYRDNDGVLHAEQFGAYCNFTGLGVGIGYEDGNIYTVGETNYSHNGQPIYRERAWPLTPEVEMHRIRVDRLEISAETGVGNEVDPDSNPQCWLEISSDGGQTFGKSRYQSLGKVGNRQARLNWRKVCTARRPVARWATTAQVKIALLGANMDAKVLSA